MSIKLLIDGAPPHWLLDHIEVVGNLRLRYRILKKSLTVKPEAVAVSCPELVENARTRQCSRTSYEATPRVRRPLG